MSATNNALRRPGLLSVLGFALACSGSCNTTPLPLDASGSKSTCAVRVYCLRGLWDLFSWGLTDLAGELQQQGIDAVAMSGTDWPKLADSLVKAYEGVDNPGPLVFIGHSYGTDNAIELSRVLNEHHIPVKLIISLDGTSPPPIPSNVERCVHVYVRSVGGVIDPVQLPGHEISLEAGNTVTDLENIAATPELFGPDVIGMTHMDIDTNPAMHRFAMDLVLPLCTGSGPQHEIIPTARVGDTGSR